MKNIYHQFKFFFSAILTTLSAMSFAQLPVSVGGKLNGEDITGGTYFGWGGDIESTSTTLYSLSITKGSAIVTADSTYDKLWVAPPGRKISLIYVKYISYRDSTGKEYYGKLSDNQLMVVLDNGDVYRLYVDHYEDAEGGIDVVNESYWDHAGSSGSEGYQKLVGDDLYLLSNAHLYVSADSTGWHVDSTGLGGAQVTDVALDTAQRVYVATNKGLLIQDTAAGSVFVADAAYTGPKNLSAVFVDRQNRLLVSVNNGGVYYSHDGTSWALDTAGIGTQFVRSFGSDHYGNLYAIASNPFTGTDHLYRSAGGTQPWQITDTSIYNKTINPIGINSFTGDSLLIVSTQFGTFISGDTGRTWVQHTKGVTAQNIYGLAKSNTGKLLLSTSLGIYSNTNGSSTWSKTYPTQGFASGLPLFHFGEKDIYTIDNTIATNNKVGVIKKSIDGGDTWQADTTGLSNVGGSYFFVDENDEEHIGNTFYGNSFLNELWAKPKNGTWATDTAGFPVKNYNYITDMASDKNGYLYVTGYFATVLMRRPIAGGSWVIDTAGLAGATSISKLKGSKGGVLATTGSKIFYRGADKWQPVPLPAGLLLPSVKAISIDSSGYIFAMFTSSTGSGVFVTGDLGQTWHDTKLDSANVTKFVSYRDTTYALSTDAGAFLLTHSAALPVTFSAITAHQQGKGIQVEWSGYNELNMSSYDVERSANGNQFNKIGNVAARNNNAQENMYSLIDASPLNGDNFYRVKAISKDGTSQYSGIVKVNISNVESGLQVYPNPIKNSAINVQLNNIPTGIYALVVYNVAGQKLYVKTISHAGGSAALVIDAKLMARGIYWVELKGGGHEFRKAIIVQ